MSQVREQRHHVHSNTEFEFPKFVCPLLLLCHQNNAYDTEM